MIDYKTIADADPGGDLDLAFSAMLTETVTESRDRKVNYVSIANEAGFAEAGALEAKVRAEIANSNLPEWVHDALKGEGLNINDPQVDTQLSALVDETVLTTAHADKIRGMKTVETIKHQGLRKGHLETARAMRERGEI